MYDNIPLELQQMPQWVCWQSVPDEAKPGKIKKIPINALTGGQAQSNNPSTWCSFEAAIAAAPRFTGIGFMFANGIFGVDLDGCGDEIEDYRNGIYDNIVAEFIHGLQSYTEYSVSGKGIHIICKGALPAGGRRKGGVEMYENGRFFIMTGDQCAEYDIVRNCTEEIKPLHEKYIGGGTAPTTGIKPALPLNLSEAQIIKMAEESKQGQLFKDLWSGSYSAYFNSQSEADMSLCNILAFWTQRDEAMMDKLFRQSGLMRAKWDRKQSGSTYGAITIRKAAKDCIVTYEPKPEYHVYIGQKPQDETTPYKHYTFDDTGNAARFVDQFGENILYNYTANKWMYYDGRRWCVDETGETKRMADEIVEGMRHGLQRYIDNLLSGEDVDDAKKNYMRHVKQMRSSRAKTSMLVEAQHIRPTNAMQFDKDSNALCVLNGMLNLVTGELLPHDRGALASKICHVEYTNKSDHPLWDKFLCEIFADDHQLIRYVQKAVGYSLTGSTQEQCVFFCYGTGRNGKSTFLDIVSEILGEYAINIQPETIMVRQASAGPTSDIARLKGARFVTTVEPNEGARINEGLLKQLSGGDRVTAAKKYENEFEFTPEFKLWMGTNHKPVIRGTDTGIWRRIHLIPFSVQIPEADVDKNLKHKLRQEMPAILSWMVDGCLLWRREGLTPPQSVLEASKSYKGEMDIIAAFLDECCEDGYEVSASELYRAYANWAKENNEYEMSGTKFGRKMGERYEKVKTNGFMVYRGINLKKKENKGGFKVMY